MEARQMNTSGQSEESSGKKLPQRKTASQEGQSQPPTESIVDRLMNIWREQGQFPPVFTPESSEAVKVQQIEEKCASLEKVNNQLQMNLAASEVKATKLSVDLVNEMTQQQFLINKLDTVWDYMSSITETINYVTETMDDCKGHSKRLRFDYDNVIKKLYVDNETLKTQEQQYKREKEQTAEELQTLTQREAELVEFIAKYQISQVEVESYRKKLEELGEDDRRLQKRIVDLEASAAEEKRRLELMCAAETEKSRQQRHLHETEIQKLLKEIEGLKERSKKSQDEKNDVFRLLAEKEEEIKRSDEAINDYKTNIEELKAELAEQTTRRQQTSDKIVKCEAEMLEKNTQISDLTQRLETAQLNMSRQTADLAIMERTKCDLEQEIVKRELQFQETETKYTQVETELRGQLAILQENSLQRISEVQELQNRCTETNSQKESISAELSKSKLLLEAVQKENENIKHKLTLMSSTKDYEVGDLKYQLEHLTKENEERQLKYTAEYQELKLKYEEIEIKYRNEAAANKEIHEIRTSELAGLNAKLQQFQQLNQQQHEEIEKLNEQINLSEQKLKRITKTDGELKEKLQAATENLKSSQQTIADLSQRNQQLEAKAKERIKIEKKLKTAEQRADEYQQKYFDVDADLNEKIRKLQRDLDAAQTKFEEANDQRFLTRSESYQKQQRNLEASEKRAQEFEQKYYALQEIEKQKFERQQKLLEEATMRAQAFEEKFKKLEAQRSDLDAQLAGLEKSLQEPQIPSPGSWRQSLAPKKVAIRADETFPPGALVAMLPPQSPKTSKPPGKVILKAPTPLSRPKVSVSPRASPVPARKPPNSVSHTSRQTSKSSNNLTLPITNDPPRSSSPDSSMMVTTDDFDRTVQKILIDLSQENSRAKSTSAAPKNTNKFFKTRGSQPK